MATFRTGFKILGEISKRHQKLPRFRSYSEDRKPNIWKPEDQWAVRDLVDTCEKKPVVKSKSWLNLFRSPPPPPPCDYRHNNCPPPVPEPEIPWYSLNINFKKKERYKPPLRTCRLAMEREKIAAEERDEPICEEIPQIRYWMADCVRPKPVPKHEPPPTPIVDFLPPKELDLNTFCENPSAERETLARKCQSAWMPYQEFRPPDSPKCKKFCLPKKPEPAKCAFKRTCMGRSPFAEFKQVDIPRPLYTRYKSVELSDSNNLLAMTCAKCPADETGKKPSINLQPPPLKEKNPKEKMLRFPDRPYLPMNTCKPIKLLNAQKFEPFRPKQTKLVEKLKYKNPCAGKPCSLNIRPLERPATSPCSAYREVPTPPRVITSTVSDEPTHFGGFSPSTRPPNWMFRLSKPGAKDTPLVPFKNYPKEPDWSSETDGLKFYDGNDANIRPKPGKEPCRPAANIPDKPPVIPPIITPTRPTFENFVLMPEKYKIKNSRSALVLRTAVKTDQSLEEFVQFQKGAVAACHSKMVVKESIFYDMHRSSCNARLTPCATPPPANPHQERKFSTCFSIPKRFTLSYPFIQSRWKSDKDCDKKISKNPPGPCKPRKQKVQEKKCNVEEVVPTCAEVRMPCCPAGRVPPDCRLSKFPKIPCKRKAAPKPSFSECNKDPPPPAKISECNCWNSKDPCYEGPGKKSGQRKFSDWAPSRQNFDTCTNEIIPVEPCKRGPSFKTSYKSIRLRNKYKSSKIFGWTKLPKDETTYFSQPNVEISTDIFKNEDVENILSGTEEMIESKYLSKKSDKGKQKNEECPLGYDRGPEKTWKDCPEPKSDDKPPPCEIYEEITLPGCQDPCCTSRKEKSPPKKRGNEIPNKEEVILSGVTSLTPKKNGSFLNMSSTRNVCNSSNKSEVFSTLKEILSQDEDSILVDKTDGIENIFSENENLGSSVVNSSGESDPLSPEKVVECSEKPLVNPPSFISLLGQRGRTPINVLKMQPAVTEKKSTSSKGFFSSVGAWWRGVFSEKGFLKRSRSQETVQSRKSTRLVRSKSISAISLIHKIRLPPDGYPPSSSSLLLAKQLEICQSSPAFSPRVIYSTKAPVKVENKSVELEEVQSEPQSQKETVPVISVEKEENFEVIPKPASTLEPLALATPTPTLTPTLDKPPTPSEVPPPLPPSPPLPPPMPNRNPKPKSTATAAKVERKVEDNPEAILEIENEEKEVDKKIEEDISEVKERSNLRYQSPLKDQKHEKKPFDDLDLLFQEEEPKSRYLRFQTNTPLRERDISGCFCRDKECPFRTDPNFEFSQVYPESLSSLLIHSTPCYMSNKIQRKQKVIKRIGKAPPNVRQLKLQRLKNSPYFSRSYSTYHCDFLQTEYKENVEMPNEFLSELLNYLSVIKQYRRVYENPENIVLMSLNSIAEKYTKHIANIHTVANGEFANGDEAPLRSKKYKLWKSIVNLKRTKLKRDMQKCATDRLKKRGVEKIVNKLEIKRHVLQVAEKMTKRGEIYETKKNIENVAENLDKMRAKFEPNRHPQRYRLFRYPKKCSQNTPAVDEMQGASSGEINQNVELALNGEFMRLDSKALTNFNLDEQRRGFSPGNVRKAMIILSKNISCKKEKSGKKKQKSSTCPLEKKKENEADKGSSKNQNPKSKSNKKDGDSQKQADKLEKTPSK